MSDVELEGEVPLAPETETAFGCPVSESRGQRVLHPASSDWYRVCETLLVEGYRMCIDLTAVDYLTYTSQRQLPEGVVPQRFEIVASFTNLTTKDRIRLRTQLDAQDLVIDSLYRLYPGSDFMEREVYDMFGVTFTGHPDLSRILMPESWVGHPLRKDYAIGSIPVQFKAPNAEEGAQ